MVSDRFVKGSEISWEDLGGGLERKILGYDKQIMMTLMRFRKGAVGARHKHVHTQVTYVHSGSFEVQIADDKRTVHAGDSFLIPSNIEHGVVALEDSILLDVFTPMREDFLRK